MDRFGATVACLTLLGVATAPAAASAEGRRIPFAATPASLATLREMEAAAAHRFEAALAGGQRPPIVAARAVLDAARGERADALRRGAAGRAARTAPPRRLADVAAALAADEALVAFAPADDRLHATVVAREPVRVVDLGPAALLVERLGALELDDETQDFAAAHDALVRDLLAPLSLPATLRTVHVAADPTLPPLPLAWLDPTRAWTTVASPATWLALVERRSATPRGEGVLAVGDPTGDAPDSLAARDALAGGRASRFVPLAAARAEARLLGDVALLGAQATEPALRRALAARRRWRTLLLAGHGLYDGARPLATGFALALSDGDDARWTTTDVLEARPAVDVVILAACDLGRVPWGEGEVALPFARAWLAAGAHNVVACRWKADDDATHALVLALDVGLRAGLAPATALARAQAAVRANARWSHPRFWAGWTVEGA